MKHWFNPDSTLSIFISRTADLAVLSLLWAVCCLPVITFIPSSVALYYVTMKFVRNEDVKIIQCFLKSMKENLKHGILLSFAFLLLFFFLYADFLYITLFEKMLKFILLFLFSAISFLAFSTMCYTIAISARFSNTAFRTVKNAFILSLQNFSKTVRIVLLNLSPALLLFIPIETLFRILPILIIFLPSYITYFCSRIFTKIFDSLPMKTPV